MYSIKFYHNFFVFLIFELEIWKLLIMCFVDWTWLHCIALFHILIFFSFFLIIYILIFELYLIWITVSVFKKEVKMRSWWRFIDFLFFSWLIDEFALCLVLGENEEKGRKIWKLNEKGIRCLGNFQHFVLFNLVFLEFETCRCLAFVNWMYCEI